MKDIELVQRLKDAGFPMKTYFGEWKENNTIVGHNLIKLDDDIYFTPTLSQLIEECGDSFRVLERRTENLPEDIPFIWQAHGFKNINKIEVDNYKTAIDLIPEIAVAKLWLEIHSNG